MCDVDVIGLGKGLTGGYGGDSERERERERESEFVIRDNFLHCRISVDYFSKKLHALVGVR